MAFLVEDGTGLAASNSYTSLSFADSYFADRGNSTWENADDDAKEIALIKATDYVDNNANFIGCILTDTQALQWPRSDTVYDEDEIPVKLQKAISEYALRALSAPLLPDPTSDASGKTVVGSKRKVGPIETELRFSDTQSVQKLKSYPAADGYLRGLVRRRTRGVIR